MVLSWQQYKQEANRGTATLAFPFPHGMVPGEGQVWGDKSLTAEELCTKGCCLCMDGGARGQERGKARSGKVGRVERSS